MGSGNSVVKVSKHQDSTLALGAKCVASAPLDGHATYDSFWEELIKTLKVPLSNEVTKEMHVVDKLDGEFRVVRIDDKDKVSAALGLATPLPEDPKTYMIYRPLKDMPELPGIRVLVEEERDSIMELQHRGVTCLIRGPPLRIEYFRQYVDHTDRRSGTIPSSFMKAVLVGALGKPVDEIVVHEDMETRIVPVPSLKSALSMPLDEYTSFDALWDGIMRVILSPDDKADVKNVTQDDGSLMIIHTIKTVDVVETELFAAAAQQATAEGRSPDEVKAAADKALKDYREAVEHGEIKSAPLEIRTSSIVRYEKECQIAGLPYKCGVYTLEVCDRVGTLEAIFHLVIHQEPLQVEAFMNPVSDRRVGEIVEAMVQFVVDKVLEEIKSKGE